MGDQPNCAVWSAIKNECKTCLSYLILSYLPSNSIIELADILNGYVIHDIVDDFTEMVRMSLKSQ